MTQPLTRRKFANLAVALAAAGGLAACAVPPSEPNIVETAVAAGSFETLVAAVTAADLVDTLSSPGPFTVFAPTDDAFAKLPAGTVESLLLPENKDQLVSILTYHVVPGAIPASQLLGSRGAVTTVQGSDIHYNGTHGVRINNATVVTPDIQTSNGIIHVIDTVLLPN